MRILCVVPAGHEADYLLKGLRELAYRIDRANDLDDAVFHCGEAAYDAVIFALDAVAEPVIERLRAASPAAALIVIASEDSSTLRTRMLRAGAHTCLSRPWSFIELQARLQAFERRAAVAASANANSNSNSKPNAMASSSNPTLDASSRSLIAGHTVVPLSRREYLVLERLMRDANAAISRDQLLDYAWTPDEHADASTVNTLISRLRAKLQAAGLSLPLETVVGHGYRFTGTFH